MRENFLLPKDDGLPTRPSKEHTKLKLAALRRYVYMFTTAMKKKWASRTYTDLLAGPGKASFQQMDISQPNEFQLGSPLIALTTEHPFTHYWFVEKNKDYHCALTQRASMSPFVSRARIFKGDCNIAVDDIVAEISTLKNSLNMAFLDPEGLKLPWITIEKLAKIERMDLIILFSTNGFIRNVENSFAKQNYRTLDRLFGGTGWRNEYSKDRGQFDRYRMVEYYKRLFARYGYKFKELSVKNRNNAEVYRLIGGGKHRRALQFWEEAITGAQREIYDAQTLPLPWKEG